MENTLKVGDVVRLKSGGPEMTVGQIKDGIAFCGWFVGKKAMAKSYLIEMLEPATTPGGTLGNRT
jgi:uncharacterized protein YodC (DUF2158 family)